MGNGGDSRPAAGRAGRRGRASGGVVGGGHVQRPVDDLLLELVDLGLELGRDLGVPVVVGGEGHALVPQGADVGGGGEGAPLGLIDGVVDGGADLLDDGGEHVGGAAVLAGGQVAVGVDPDDGVGVAPGGLDGGQGALADRAGHGHDDVGALGQELLGELLALGGVGEVAHEGAARGVGRIPAQDLDGGAVVRVVLLHALGEALHEDLDGGDGLAAVGGDLAGLGGAGGGVAGQVGGLGGVEDEGLGVGQAGLGELGVDEGEPDVGVLLGGLGHVVGQVEADPDNEVALLLDEGVDVRRVVGGALGLHGHGLNAEVGTGPVQALLAGLVEGLVVEAALVGDHAGLEVRGGARAPG